MNILKRAYIIIFLMLFVQIANAQQRNRLHIPEVYGMPGSDVTLAIHLDNTSFITAFQFTLDLPEGFVADLSSLTLADRNEDHIVTSKPLGDNKYLIVGYSASNKPLRGNSGKLLTLKIKIPLSCVEDEKYAVGISELLLCLSDGNNVADEPEESYVCILKTPDLSVSDVGCNLSQVAPGENIEVSWSVRNVGGSVANDGWKEYIFFSDENNGTEKLLAATNYNDGIEPGAIVARNVSFTVPDVLGMDGGVGLYVKLIPYSTTGELPGNDGNNVASATSGIVLGKRAYLELENSIIPEAGQSSVRCKVVRSGGWGDKEVFDVFSDSGRLTVPSSVTIEEGQSAAYFNINVIDNNILDMNDSVLVRLQSDSYGELEKYIIIKDNELPKLYIETGNSEYYEGDTVMLTVNSEIIVPYDLTVSLACENANRVRIPKNLTIPAGSNSAQTYAVVVDDNLPALTVTPSIKAYANNFTTAERVIIVYDNDMPEFELSLMPAAVNESSGASATIATIRRTKNIDSKAVLKLKDNSNGRIYYLKNPLTFKPGVETMQIEIGVVDDHVIDGDKEYIISGNVYLSDCDCTAGGVDEASCSSTLVVTDDDSPSLSFLYDSNIVFEGAIGTSITVNRNFDSDKELAVTLSSNNDRLLFDRSVVIPAGMRSATFNVSAEQNEHAEDTELVSLNAKADGVSDGNCWIVINDRSLADARIKLTIDDEVLYAGKNCTATAIIYNDGNVVLPENLPFLVFFNKNENRKECKTSSPVNPGDSLVMKISDLLLPNRLGSNKVQAVVNPDACFEELLYINNNSNVCNIDIEIPYDVTVSAEKERYGQNDVVMIYGTVSGDFDRNTEVEVFFINNGSRLAVPVKIEEDGSFSLEFTLPHKMIGEVEVGVCFPGSDSRDVSDSFIVNGIYTDNYYDAVDLVVNEELKGKFIVYNPCDIMQSNVNVTIGEESGNSEFNFEYPKSIEPYDSIVVEYTARPNAVTEGLDWQLLPLTVSADGGASADYKIYYYVNSQYGKLYTTSPEINTTLSIDTPREYRMWIYNIGKGETGKITFSLPDCMETVTPKEMSSLVAGDSALVIMRLKPTDDMKINVPVKGKFGINCENGSGVPISFEITPVSDKKAFLTVDVVDENTIYAEGNPHVGYAYVVLKKPTTGEVVCEGYTGADGQFSVETDEGYYKLEVNAEKHKGYTRFIMLDPGKTNNLEVFLPYDAITYSWSVVETEIEDEYIVETVMEYDIRVPKAIVEIVLPNEKPADNTVFPVKIVNRGLIAAADISLDLSIQDQYGNKFPITFLNDPFVERLMPSSTETFYAVVSSTPRPALSKQRAQSNFNNLGAKCLYLISKAKYQQLCKQYKDENLFAEAVKRFSTDSICPNMPEPYYNEGDNNHYYGNGPGKHGGSNGNSGRGYHDETLLVNLENPRAYCEDWIPGKLVALNGNMKGKPIKGISADGVSRAKIVLDEESLILMHEYGRYDLKWSLSEDVGTLEVGESVFDDVVYVAPDDFPLNNGKFKHRIKAILRSSKDDYRSELSSVEIDIVRPPLLLLHGLFGDRNTWSEFQNYLVGEKHLYESFAILNMGYKGTNNVEFSKNVGHVEWLASRAINSYTHEKYQASKLDIVGHSMGGILGRLYAQAGNVDKVHKLITVNTPHAGSEFADIILSHEEDVSELLKIMHDHFLNENTDFSLGAIKDLSVGSKAIADLNSYSCPDIPVHAIATHLADNVNLGRLSGMLEVAGGISKNRGFLLNALGVLSGNLAHFLDDISQYHPKSDFVVNIESQIGNRNSASIGGYTLIPGVMHIGSTNNASVQDRIEYLLKGSVHSGDFIRSWFDPAPREFDESGCVKEGISKIVWDLIPEECETYYDVVHGTIKIINPDFNVPISDKTLAVMYDVASGASELKEAIEMTGDLSKAKAKDTGDSEPVTLEFEVPSYFSGDVKSLLFFIDETNTLHCGKYDFTVEKAMLSPQRIEADSVYYMNVSDTISFGVKCVYTDGSYRYVEPDNVVFTEPVAAYTDGYVRSIKAGNSSAMVYYKGLYCETEFLVYDEDDVEDDVEDDDAEEEAEEESSNICSTISMSFKQSSVVTRQAFLGTFKFANGNEYNSVEEFRLYLRIADEEGNIATEKEFYTGIESMKGFVGKAELGSIWSIDAGKDGEVSIIFIPTNHAAPDKEKEYAFGGYISYKDPVTGVMVTRDMNDVKLKVSPLPNLEFTYFLQRDVFGDDPLTQVVEPMVPAEFALVINNNGNADAKNLKIATGRPQIVSNEKGVLVNFDIVSAELNGEEKSLSLDGSSDMDFGTIKKDSQTYAQWWLQSSLMGHFVKYDVNVTRISNYEDENLSVIDTASIHELIRGFDYLKTPDKGVRAFLVNDIEDSRDLPDRIYFSDATNENVTIAQDASIEKISEQEYMLTVKPAYEGWNYGYIVDPTNGRQKIASVTCSGEDIDDEQMWQTDRTLRDGKDPIYESLIHFADNFCNAEKVYTLIFEEVPDVLLAVDTIYADCDLSEFIETPLECLYVQFNKPIDETSFTVEDVSLNCQGVALDVSDVRILRVSEMLYKIDLSNIEQNNGYYVLTVQTKNITDIEGYKGSVGLNVAWNLYANGDVYYEIIYIIGEKELALPETAISKVGRTITLRASHVEGYDFHNWTKEGHILSSDTVFEYIVDDNVRIEANYTRIENLVRINYNRKSGVVSGSAEGVYDYGEELTLCATPLDGYFFAGWLLNDSVVENSSQTLSLKVDRPITVEAVFKSYVLGDVDGNGEVTATDISMLASFIIGKDTPEFMERMRGDFNKDNLLSIADVVGVAGLASGIELNGSVSSTDNVALKGIDFEAVAGHETLMSLLLELADGAYYGLQADVVLPTGMEVKDIELAAHLTDYNVEYGCVDNNKWRILVYSAQMKRLPGFDKLLDIVLFPVGDIPSEDSFIELCGAKLVDALLDEVDLKSSYVYFNSITDGIDLIRTDMAIEGGTALFITSLIEDAIMIYSLDGRAIRSVMVRPGKNVIRLPRGVYMVCGQKVVIK